MPHWVAPVVMKRKPVPKSVSFRTVMNLDSGIQKINARNYGIFLTGRNNPENTSEFSPSATGQKWTFGSTFFRKISRCHHSTFTHIREVFERDEVFYAALPA